MDNHASADLLVKVFEKFKDQFEGRFGSNIQILRIRPYTWMKLLPIFMKGSLLI